ncbi:MAG TPA: ArsB/NhaD family transporter [Mycobacterium sp.]|jgi:Na+/H+ antiporter NhaD/arsenite permease-like protein|nr:ArsB/NhaD family transporter [Mycobacterium sp.]
MSVVAVVVFVVAYVLIASDRVNKTLVALAGAAIVVALPVISSDDVFYSRNTGIAWDVIFLLLGMMIIVSVLRQTGVFEYTAIWAAKRARGSPLRIMILLVLVTAFASALLDNVTTVLLIAPVTLLVCDRLEIGPAPFLMAEAFASNIGGTATLIGDPPSIIIGSRAGLSFNDFLIHVAPIVIVIIAVFVALLPRLFRGAFDVDPERVADVMSLEEREAIRDPRLLVKCGVVLAAVLAAFVAHGPLHMEPSIAALLGAGILIVISGLEHSDYLSGVEWETLLFFAGLFVMVGALVKTGVVDELSRWATEATGGHALLTTMLILAVSFVLSGVINNVPYAATMAPIVGQLVPSMVGHVHPQVLWWALVLGTDLGGNLTAVGASANVVILGIARRADSPISFSEFTRKGAIVTVISIGISAVYLWVRYFVLA